MPTYLRNIYGQMKNYSVAMDLYSKYIICTHFTVYVYIHTVDIKSYVYKYIHMQ